VVGVVARQRQAVNLRQRDLRAVELVSQVIEKKVVVISGDRDMRCVGSAEAWP
jgi:hypothetical protein